MAFFEIKDVEIVGFSAAVPKNTGKNMDLKFVGYDAESFIKNVGVKERRIGDFTTSDLCFEAAQRLINDLQWEKESIDMIVFVSQTADYILPATSCILQDRLGLSKECYALDISLGCSGWPYGLSSVGGLLSKQGMKRALLMVGDAKGRVKVHQEDPLFGHAGTVTALQFAEGAEGFKFHVGTDGSGYEAIIMPDGGARNIFTGESLKLKRWKDGTIRKGLYAAMNGMDVFSFGITTAPKSVKSLSEHFQIDLAEVDYFVFHQANKMMNEKIRKKLKIQEEKNPYSIEYYGNTSSASIPLTVVTELKGKITQGMHKLIACGFGVGLSWATVAFDTNNVVISELIEMA